MPSERYRLICVLDSISDGDNTQSSMDVSPDYLHIHILKSSYLNPLDDFINSSVKEYADDALYQWGIPFEKNSHTRSAKVSAEEIFTKGNIGIGSAARGDNEDKEDFIGGGEGFLTGSQNFRVSKGNKVFSASTQQSYWTFQVSDFANSQKFDDITGIIVHGRENLMILLKDKSAGRPLIATFDAEFVGDFFARSNGIFPEDVGLVENPEKVLFSNDAEGGHLVGGSNNSGDLDSLSRIFSLDESMSSDFSIRIASSVAIKPIDEVKIFKKNGDFRSPRTEIEVNHAAQLIQKTWQNYKT